MYNPIKLNHVPSRLHQYQKDKFMKSFHLEPITESTFEEDNVCMTQEIYTEAVFINGKKTLEPVVKIVDEIKKSLEVKIELQRSTSSTNKPQIFDPSLFWKDPLFKSLEDQLQKIFGFRNAEIHPYIEKYDSDKNVFESNIMNCEIGYMLRYPIDGIVTDKGFYDGTKSLNFRVYITLGLVHKLTAEEIVAVLLHEFGHSIDPAVVDINYIKTNILSKYLTDREKEMTDSEKKFSQVVIRKKYDSIFIPLIAGIAAISGIAMFIKMIINFFRNKFTSTEKREQKRQEEINMAIQRLRDIIQKDNEFNRRNYSEAFADNFARMYGFGAYLAAGLKKMQDNTAMQVRSRVQKEQDRQDLILHMVESALKDEHKTNIHRIRALLKEYEIDLNDPNISQKTKVDIKGDMDELRKVLDSYMNSFSDFQNRINKIINEELENIEGKSIDTPATTIGDPLLKK